jgi:nucleotidyltransferase/DNA polymerase involved in DNA repair
MPIDDTHPNAYWSRAIILVDMNAFFCSVKQIDHPERYAQMSTRIMEALARITQRVMQRVILNCKL